jgi:ADP-ribosyl-[dinitrogen reductase] hydrolase
MAPLMASDRVIVPQSAMPSKMRTSQTDPLRIATLSVGEHGGAIGVTFAPGKQQAVAMTGAWARDLDQDLLAIKHWGAEVLLTLLEPRRPPAFE